MCTAKEDLDFYVDIRGYRNAASSRSSYKKTLFTVKARLERETQVVSVTGSTPKRNMAAKLEEIAAAEEGDHGCLSGTIRQEEEKTVYLLRFADTFLLRHV